MRRASRRHEPIDPRADERPPVHGPVDYPHLKILAALARKLMRPAFRQSLLDAEKPSDVVQTVNNEVVTS